MFRTNAVPVLLLTALAGCKPLSDVIVVGSSASNHDCPNCAMSPRDNPPILVTAELGQSKGPGGEDLFERAASVAFGAQYNNLRFDLFVKGDETRGSSDMDELIPHPAGIGDWAAEPGKVPLAVPLEIRGIELGYSVSEASLVHRDAVGTSTEVLSQPIKAELAPNVMLVPVQVIRVRPQDMSSPAGVSVSRFTREVHKAYWDDRPDYETFRNAEPGVPNHYSQHALNGTKLPWANADQIWAQCNIQFRMINCPGTELGCPDLVAETDSQVTGTTCTAGFNADASKNWADAMGLPGVNSDLPIVVFMNRVTASTCEIIDVAKSGRAALGYSTASFQSELVLAHEMGHVLGLKDVRCESGNADQGHLMCDTDAMQTERILASDCAKARSAAAGLVKRHWNTVVAP
jgi:hypothetical protein